MKREEGIIIIIINIITIINLSIEMAKGHAEGKVHRGSVGIEIIITQHHRSRR